MLPITLQIHIPHGSLQGYGPCLLPTHSTSSPGTCLHWIPSSLASLPNSYQLTAYALAVLLPGMLASQAGSILSFQAQFQCPLRGAFLTFFSKIPHPTPGPTTLLSSSEHCHYLECSYFFSFMFSYLLSEALNVNSMRAWIRLLNLVHSCILWA